VGKSDPVSAWEKTFELAAPKKRRQEEESIERDSGKETGGESGNIGGSVRIFRAQEEGCKLTFWADHIRERQMQKKCARKGAQKRF